MKRRRILDVRIQTWEENGNKKLVGEYAVGFIDYGGPFVGAGGAPFIGIGNEEYVGDYDNMKEVFGVINHEQVHWTLWHQIFKPDQIPKENQTFDKIAKEIGL